MRVVPKGFTGFKCGQFQLEHRSDLGTIEGVMEYQLEVAVRLYVPKAGLTVQKLYRELKAGIIPTQRGCFVDIIEIPRTV